MKKITLLTLCMAFVSNIMLAQFDFPTIAGPENASQSTPATLNLNDNANSASVPSGEYGSFIVTADWNANGTTVWSNDTRIIIATSGSQFSVSGPTSGGANNGNPATLVFEGFFGDPGYDPSLDSELSLILDATFGGSEATSWSNIQVQILPPPTCPAPSNVLAFNATTDSVEIVWLAGGTETSWDLELVDITGGEVQGSGTVTTDITTLPTNASPFIITGLTPENEYEVYVRADCGATDGVSTWQGINGFPSFTTLAIPLTSADSPLVDDGGINGNYSVSPGNVTISEVTIVPDNPGEVVSLELTEVQIEVSPISDIIDPQCYAWLTFVDGPTFDFAKVIGEFQRCGQDTGDSNTELFPDKVGNQLRVGDVITSSDPTGALTVRFTVNGNNASLSLPGYQAIITSSTTLSTNDFNSENGFTYSPNPVTDVLNLRAQKNIESVELYNALGQNVLRTSPKSFNSTLDMSGLRGGIYFAKVTIENATKTVRVIKK